MWEEENVTYNSEGHWHRRCLEEFSHRNGICVGIKIIYLLKIQKGQRVIDKSLVLCSTAVQMGLYSNRKL